LHKFPILKKIHILILFFFSLYSNCQTVRKFSNDFLNIGVDAAALGMSNAVTAHSGDVNSCYWNPAGLMNLESNQAAAMHASYFANIAQYDYIAYAAPIDASSAWGVSAIRFGVDDILNTTQLIDNQGRIDYNRISLFSVADYAFTFSYARKSRLANFRYGVNAKIIRRIIGDFANSWGFGFDGGLQYQTNNNWKFGLMVRDITTTYNIWNIDETQYATISNAIPGQNQELPQTTEITAPKAQLGLSKKINLKTNYSLLASANLNMQFTRTNDIISSKSLSIEPAIGFEGGYSDLAFLRIGVGNFQKITTIDQTKSLSFQPNMGLGFKYKGIEIDYALTNIAKQSQALYSNIFSIKVDLSIFK
jgi:hypothetical protein